MSTYIGPFGLVGVFDDGLKVPQDFAFGEDRLVVLVNYIEPVYDGQCGV